ncbi:NAD(P)-binding protein [Cantharellus anzutake]|uniref:NAD(P)-binding protein n=1 Tax=Cantharellus anzutake TaxID=1750568 RepID=UPI001908AC0C|nr:NAD(P)-binding protein [Cantharellus anzutake]KAF8312747.1 NAD(P)-binding protein [Cantharellus anzutake]
MDKTRVWFITGCSSGFGRRIAHRALALGDKVIATARRVEHLDGLKAAGATVMRLDVTDPMDVINKVAEDAEAVYKRVDIVVNNAGSGVLGPLEEIGPEGLEQQYKVNVFGVLAVAKAFLPYMRQRREGIIVIMGSRSGWRIAPGIGAYSTSKAAVNLLGETLAAEVAPFNIRVLTLIPGGFHTEGIVGNPVIVPSHPNHIRISDYDAFRRDLESRMKKLPGTQLGDPDKLAEVVTAVVGGEGIMTGERSTSSSEDHAGDVTESNIRPWPKRLFLGSDAEKDVRDRMAEMNQTMIEWSDVLKSTDRTF